MELVRGHVPDKCLSWDLKPGLTGMFSPTNQTTSHEPNPREVSVQSQHCLRCDVGSLSVNVLRHTMQSPRLPVYWGEGWRSFKVDFWTENKKKKVV